MSDAVFYTMAIVAHLVFFVCYITEKLHGSINLFGISLSILSFFGILCTWVSVIV